VRRQVAIKVLHENDEQFVRRFEREALAIGALTHNHILPLYDFGAQRPWYYLVMPFVEGGTLRDLLIKQGRLTLDEAGIFLDQIASALQHAHNYGVIHRDVKPSNILLRPDGHAYLADFGLAKASAETDPHPHSGIGFGTPEYMAPEQSDGINDYRSDIYSLGIILYQMLTGRVPFTADSPMAVTLKHLQLPPPKPSQINPDIPPEIEEIILKALAKRPEERYQEASDFANAYKHALVQEHFRAQTLPTIASVIIHRSQQELHTTQQNLQEISPHICQALSNYPFDVTPRLQPTPIEDKIITPQFDPYRKNLKKHLSHSRLLIPLISLFILLLSTPLSITFFWQIHSQLPIQKARPTTTSASHKKQQIVLTTTATWAQQQSTMAAQARERAISDITPPIDAGKVLYYNSMLAPTSDWLNDGKQCSFRPQGYTVSAQTTHTVAWCYNSHQHFDNAIITTQASLIRGDFYGVIFRLNPTSKTFYVLELNSSSQFRFQQAVGHNPSQWLTLIDWTWSSAVAAGYGQQNTFLIIAKGRNFRFYMNRQLIVSTFTNTSYAIGLMGLLVGGDNPKGTEAIFTNIAVFKNN
jgi:serine/threonine protein kinase